MVGDKESRCLVVSSMHSPAFHSCPVSFLVRLTVLSEQAHHDNRTAKADSPMSSGSTRPVSRHRSRSETVLAAVLAVQFTVLSVASGLGMEVSDQKKTRLFASCDRVVPRLPIASSRDQPKLPILRSAVESCQIS